MRELILIFLHGRLAAEPAEEDAEDLFALLEQAKNLGDPTRGLYRIESELHQRFGKKGDATRSAAQATLAQTPSTALDHFLEGERHRLASGKPSDEADGLSSEERAGKLQQAIEEYERALELNPDHYWSNLQLGRCLMAQGKAAESLAYSRTCMALKPNTPWGQNSYALTLALLGRDQDAIQHLDRLVGKHPSFLPGRLNRGFAHLRMKRFAPALEDFDVILKAPNGSQLIDAAYYRGQIHLQNGNFQAAIDDTTELIRCRPKFRPAYALRARARFGKGDQPGALADTDQCVALMLRGTEKRESTEWLWQHGRLLHRVAVESGYRSKIGQQVLKLAAKDLAAASSSIKSPQSFVELGSVQHRLGKLDEAIATYTSGLETNPNDAQLLALRAAALDDKSKHDEAASDFQLVTTIPPVTIHERQRVADAYVRLGIIHAYKNQLTEAQGRIADVWITLQDNEGGKPIAPSTSLQFNLACIYGELSKQDDPHRPHFQDRAIKLIEASLRSAQREEKKGWTTIVEKEKCFDSIKHLPAFASLLEKYRTR